VRTETTEAEANRHLASSKKDKREDQLVWLAGPSQKDPEALFIGRQSNTMAIRWGPFERTINTLTKLERSNKPMYWVNIGSETVLGLDEKSVRAIFSWLQDITGSDEALKYFYWGRM
jgi:hypothetical protein